MSSTTPLVLVDEEKVYGFQKCLISIAKGSLTSPLGKKVFAKMGFLNLLLVAMIPVLKVLLVTAVGLFLALDRINLLGQEAIRHLNNLVFYVFIPALVVSYLAETITFQSLVALWFMPVNILLTFVIGSALAWILIKITRTPKHLQGMVIGFCSSGNQGNLFLIMIPALCYESNNPFGDSSVCSTKAEAYASLSNAIGAVFTWSYVYAIMLECANKSRENESTIGIISCGETETNSDNGREALLPSRDCHRSEDYSRQGGDQLPCTILRSTFQHIKIVMAKIDLKKVFAPTSIASFVGLAIGIISPIREVLIGDNAPLHVIDTSVFLIGEAAIPCMTLILGANLLRGLKRSDVSIAVVIGIMVVRYLLLPLLGIGVVKVASHFHMTGSDSLYQFVLMLQYACPPAISVGTMTELFQQGQAESSVILLWTYAVAFFFVTLWSTLYMWLLA